MRKKRRMFGVMSWVCLVMAVGWGYLWWRACSGGGGGGFTVATEIRLTVRGWSYGVLWAGNRVIGFSEVTRYHGGGTPNSGFDRRVDGGVVNEFAAWELHFGGVHEGHFPEYRQKHLFFASTDSIHIFGSMGWAGMTTSFWSAGFPVWVGFAVFLIWPIISLARYFRFRSRSATRCVCENCGYDLRGHLGGNEKQTGITCPECGVRQGDKSEEVRGGFRRRLLLSVAMVQVLLMCGFICMMACGWKQKRYLMVGGEDLVYGGWKGATVTWFHGDAVFEWHQPDGEKAVKSSQERTAQRVRNYSSGLKTGEELYAYRDASNIILYRRSSEVLTGDSRFDGAWMGQIAEVGERSRYVRLPGWVVILGLGLLPAWMFGRWMWRKRGLRKS